MKIFIFLLLVATGIRVNAEGSEEACDQVWSRAPRPPLTSGKDLTIEDLKQTDWIVFETISGSHLYGLATEKSDTDIAGVFIAPPKMFFAFESPEQIKDEKHNAVYYELKKFLRLLAQNKPNALEVLAATGPLIQVEHPVFAAVRNFDFLSKQCYDSIANYALSQVKKAKGTKKMISNPMPEKAKGPLEFCHVMKGSGSVELEEWLKQENHDAATLGLTKIPKVPDTYAVFKPGGGYSFAGIKPLPDGKGLVVSSIAPWFEPIAYLHFNRNAFNLYREDHRKYWEWVKTRNEDRFALNMAHNKDYDAKSMATGFRLLAMGRMIALNHKIDFSLLHRDDLLRIRSGEFEYEDLVAQAEEQVKELQELFANSRLPSTPNIEAIEELHVRTRLRFYRERGWLP